MDEEGAKSVSEGPQLEVGYECEDCELAFRSPQGLAGHKRLAHSISTAQELDQRQKAIEQRSQAFTARERAAHHRETELARRERAIREAEEIPEAARLRAVVSEEIEALPEVSSETILRCDGWDYRFEGGELVHVYFPQGEKTEFAEGEPFRIGGRAFCIRSRGLERVHPATLLARVLARGD
jgi:hypothetical protein